MVPTRGKSRAAARKPAGKAKAGAKKNGPAAPAARSARASRTRWCWRFAKCWRGRGAEDQESGRMATRTGRKSKPKKTRVAARAKPAPKKRAGGGLRAVPDPLPRERPKDEAVALVPILQEADQRTADQKTNRAASRGKYVYCIMRTSDQLKFGP